MENGKMKIIACPVVIEELKSKMPGGIDYEILDFGLHNTPSTLKERLQETINNSHGYETIVLAYGLCGHAVVGLKSETSTLVVPRADDCIAIFMGSREAYLKEQREHPGSYFLSKGWIEGRIDDSGPPPLMKDYQRILDKYGEARARRMQEVYQEKFKSRHYQRMAFINTSSESDLEIYKETARKRAEKMNLKYEEISGSTAYMEKIARREWDDEFMIAPPGQAIRVEDFLLPEEKAS